MIKTKVAFLESRLFSSQSELFEYFLNCSDWLDKSRPCKKSHFCFDHVNRLLMLFPTLGSSNLPVVVAQLDKKHANIKAFVLECYDRHKANNI